MREREKKKNEKDRTKDKEKEKYKYSFFIITLCLYVKILYSRDFKKRFQVKNAKFQILTLCFMMKSSM